jgi:hypothetical protein
MVRMEMNVAKNDSENASCLHDQRGFEGKIGIQLQKLCGFSKVK